MSIRGFRAAETSRLIQNWRTDCGYTAKEIKSYLSTLRGRSRELEKDAPAYKRWLELCATNVVGQGFALKSLPHDGVPWIQDESNPNHWRLDEDAALFLQYHWRQFCNTRDPKTGLTWCDASGRKTDAELDRLNIRTKKRDGEYFIRSIKTSKNPYGIAWQVIRPDHCDHRYCETTKNGNEVRNGVELDKTTGRVVAYYFGTSDRYANCYHGSQALARIPVEEIIHGYTQHDEQQTRGIPEGVSAMVKLKMLEELDISELTAAREDANITRTYEASQNADADAFQDLTEDDNSDAANALIQESEPGQKMVLPPGWTEKLNAPNHPNLDLIGFKSGMMRDVANGFSLEYANFANDWSGVTFSSVRQGTISERDMWIVEQDDFISQCKTPQFLAWLESFLEQPISNPMTSKRYEKFSEHGFTGRRWMWVDPMRDMKAAEIAVDRKWKTNSQVTEEMGGNYAANVEISSAETSMITGDTEETVPPLNGAQIAAALEIMGQYATGAIGEAAALGLLTAAGVPAEAAQNMVSEQTVTVKEESE
jgi:lambda family phage portal protein